MTSLAIGVDNIHHDVYLSPRFVHASRDYLFELIRQHTAGSFISGVELRNAKTIDGAGFRKLLTDCCNRRLLRPNIKKISRSMFCFGWPF